MRKVPVAQVKSLLASRNFQRESELSTVSGLDVYAFGDEILTVAGAGPGRLFLREEFLQILSNVDKTSESLRSMRAPLRDAQHFILTAASRSAQLRDSLRITLQPWSQVDLEAVDSSFRRLPKEVQGTPAMFCGLVAYVGEYVRLTTNGAWRVFDAGYPEPRVLRGDGVEVRPEGVVMLALGELEDPPRSLDEALRSDFFSRQLRTL